MIKKKALVLVNIGAGRNKEELKIFLDNFHDDKRNISTQKSLLKRFLQLFNFRSRVDENWPLEEESQGGIALYEHTKELTRKLSEALPQYYVTYSMLYTEPFAQSVVDEIENEGIKEALLLPMYPHYTIAKTANSIQDFTIKSNYILKISSIESLYMNEIYNKAICEEIIRVQSKYKDFHLIFVANLPLERNRDKGDFSLEQIEEHVEILKEKLSWCVINLQSINIAYQSEEKKSSTNGPDLKEMLKNFVKKKVIIYPLSYAIDNTQTLYDLHIKYKKIAQKEKVLEYRVCNCMNSNDTFVEAIQELVSS